MIVAVGIAAAWFEYSYRRNRRSKTDSRTAQNGGAKENEAISSTQAEEKSKQLKVASSND